MDELLFRLYQHLPSNNDEHRKLIDDLRAVIAENDALRADRDRLNWLEMNPRNAEIIVDDKSQPCLYYAVAGDFGVRLRYIIDVARNADAIEKGGA